MKIMPPMQLDPPRGYTRRQWLKGQKPFGALPDYMRDKLKRKY